MFLSLIQAQQAVLLDKVSSVVENKIILLSDVVLAANAIAAEQKINPNTNPKEFFNILKNAQESMIEQLLIIEMAAIDSVSVLESEVENALNNQINNIISQAGSKEKAEELLGKKISDFKRSYKDDMRGKLVAEKYTSSLTQKINITRGEVINFFDTYKDSLPNFPTTYDTYHILLEIKPSKESEKKALEKILNIKNKIENGLSFEEAAKTFSEDPMSKVGGGNLGYVSRGSFVKEFEKVAFTIEKNVLSKPVKSRFGYHLIEVLDRAGEKVLVRHILIRPQISESDKINTYNQAEKIKKDIINKDDFINSAKKFSDDNTNNKNGGYLGLIDINTYQISEISNKLKELKVGSISTPILTDYGYHILFLNKINVGGKPTLEKNYIDLEKIALNKKKSDWYQNWINEIKSQFYIKRNPLTYPQING